MPTSAVTDSRFDYLLQKARQGPLEAADVKAAISELLVMYRPFLVSLAKQKIPVDQSRKISASDVVQETLILAMDGFEGFNTDTPQSLLGWLTTILTNKIIDNQRMFGAEKRDMNREILLSAQESRELWKELAMPPQPNQRDLNQERWEEVQLALLNLKPHHREVILMRHHEGLSWQEVADRLESTPDGCRMLYERALEKLRNII